MKCHFYTKFLNLESFQSFLFSSTDLSVFSVTWRRQWHPTPALLPGKSHGWRSLVGCSPWGRWESDTTERLHFHFSLACIGEGNGTPLQCSRLENPRDGGAWWAAVSGVAQSRTRLSDLAAAAAVPPNLWYRWSLCLSLLFFFFYDFAKFTSIFF